MANKGPDDLHKLTLPRELLEALEDSINDSPELAEAAMRYERLLIKIAARVAGDAILVGEEKTEEERVRAAHRLVKLTGELYEALASQVGPGRNT
ncbi:MAG TPA: hypothetical protein VNT60_05135 [Deinococcales bacterium]|nr:hypothetical protein [Deinococcales bacterium]